MGLPEQTQHAQRSAGAPEDPGAPPAPGAAPAPGAPAAARVGRAAGRLDRLAIVPLPVLGAAILLLWVADVRVTYAAPGLLLALNFAFLTLASSLVAYLGVRGFLVRGEPALLLLACGGELLGLGVLLSTVAGWDDPNVAVTIHNTCAALAGGCHLAGVVAARRPRRTVRRVDLVATGALGAGLILPTVIAGAALERLTPTFFVQGAGGTVVRNLVLAAAVVLFGAAAAVLAAGGTASSRFKRHYALALALLSAGLAGVLLQPAFGSLVGWTARATQFLGGAYLLAAAIAAVRETKGWALSLERESERLYRAIGESIDYGVWVCEPDGRNVYASESFLKLVGITQRQCSDFGWGDVLHPEDAERTIAAWKECCRTGGTWDIEHRYRGVDGRWHPILARGVPVRNEQGEIVCWAGINLDIARLKEAEQSLRDSDQRKSEFLAVLSHELRNPLAPLRNAVHLLALAPHDSAPARRAREVIERQVDHLARLVDDLLDVTRLSRGKVTLARARLDLREAVIRTCDDHRPLLAQRGLALQVSVGDPAPVDADPTRIAQVIGNLLGNAAKFTPQGGTVKVTLASGGGSAELTVEDDGAGIDAALLPRIFEPFTQAERSLARTQGGLGLGLSLVKGLVELHGGEITARSEGEGRGATFVVTLPLAAPAETPAPPAPAQRPQAGLDVLIVEDGADAAATLADLLELAGHRVRVARDGRSGVALATGSPPDLVLCDLGLPDLDGFAVARALRADPALRRTRLVALSGYALPEDRARAAEAGFDAHLAKPAKLAELELLLEDVLRTRAAGG